MPRELSCNQCGAAVPLPEDSFAPWMECPHCRARVVNMHALVRTGERMTWAVVVGTLLALFAMLGWVCGLGPVVLVGAFGGRNTGTEVDLCAHTVCCALVLIAGVLLACAGKERYLRGARLAFAGVAVVVALALVVLSGLIVVYAVCFGSV